MSVFNTFQQTVGKSNSSGATKKSIFQKFQETTGNVNNAKTSTVKTANVPKFLGGGQFQTAGPGTLVTTSRDYAGIEEQSGSWREHKIPVSLGGTSSDQNVVKRTTAEGKAKTNQELKIIDEYKSGKISLPEARAAVLKVEREIQGLEPKQGLWNALGDVLSNPLKLFGDTVKTISDFITNAPVVGLKNNPLVGGNAMKAATSLIPKKEEKSMKFEVGQGVEPSNSQVLSLGIGPVRKDLLTQEGKTAALLGSNKPITPISEDARSQAIINAFGNSFLPTNALKMVVSKIEPNLYASNPSIDDALAQRFPISSTIANLAGNYLSLYLLGKVTSPIAPGVDKAIGEFKFLNQPLARAISYATQTGATFGLNDFSTELINQARAGKFNEEMLAGKTIKGIGTGIAFGAAHALPTAPLRIGVAGGSMSILSLGEGYLSDKKIDKKDVISALANGILAAGMEYFNGKNVSEAYKNQEMRDFMKSKTVSRIMGNVNSTTGEPYTRAEAEKIYLLFQKFGDSFGRSNSAYVEILENLPNGWDGLPSEIKTKWANEFTKNIFKNIDANINADIAGAANKANKTIPAEITNQVKQMILQNEQAKVSQANEIAQNLIKNVETGGAIQNEAVGVAVRNIIPQVEFKNKDAATLLKGVDTSKIQTLEELRSKYLSVLPAEMKTEGSPVVYAIDQWVKQGESVSKEMVPEIVKEIKVPEVKDIDTFFKSTPMQNEDEWGAMQEQLDKFKAPLETQISQLEAKLNVAKPRSPEKKQLNEQIDKIKNQIADQETAVENAYLEKSLKERELLMKYVQNNYNVDEEKAGELIDEFMMTAMERPGIEHFGDKTMREAFDYTMEEAGLKPKETKKAPKAPKVDKEEELINELQKHIMSGDKEFINKMVEKAKGNKQLSDVLHDAIISAQARADEVKNKIKVGNYTEEEIQTEIKKMNTEFKVGDVLNTQGNSNMADPITIREITGNTLKFTDAEGKEYQGMARATVRTLIKNGEWKKEAPKETNKRQEILDEYRKSILPEYNTNEKIIALDAFVDKIRELDPKDESDTFQIEKGNKYEVTISYPHSLGEMGNSTDFVYKIKPTITELSKDILDTYNEFLKDVNEPLGITGIVAKSGRDENIESAIKKVMETVYGRQPEIKAQKESPIKDLIGKKLTVEKGAFKGVPIEVKLNITGKVGPFYRVDTMDYGTLKSLHGKKFADEVESGIDTTVYRAGKEDETLKDGTFLTADSKMARSYQTKSIKGFGGPKLYKYTIPARDLVSVDNLDFSELIYKPKENPYQIENGAGSYSEVPAFGKEKMKSLLKYVEGLKENPVLTVEMSGDRKVLRWSRPGKDIKIYPEAINLNPDNLEIGQKITLDAKRLLKEPVSQLKKEKYAEVGGALGFNPKNLENLDGPDAKVETDKIIKRSEIANTLSEKLGVPIRKGKFRIAGALGIYKPDVRVIRYKAGGLPTKFHEVAHFLDYTVFHFSKAINKVEREALMEEYGFSYANEPTRQREEAFAEFLRYTMTGQSERAKKMAPKFYEFYNNEIKKFPEIKEVLETATQDFQRWKEMPAVAKVVSQISFKPENKGNLYDRITNTLHNWYTMALDDLHPLSEFSKLGEKNIGKIPAAEDPYILARNFRGWIGRASVFLKKGTFGKNYYKIENGKAVVNFKGKSFEEIVKPIADAGKLTDFSAYLVAQRALELAERKITTGIRMSDAKEAMIELQKKNPEFIQAGKDLLKYQDDLLEYAAENGLIGTKALAKIKELNKLRVPFYRVMEETRSSFMGGKKLAGNLASPIKKIKGSEREIIDPLEGIIKDTYAIINTVERNNIGLAMANLASKHFELGRLFERVVRPMKPITVNVQEVLQNALKGEMDTSQIPEDLGEIMVTLFRPTQDRGPNMLNVNAGDSQLVFQVDPDLFKAIQGLNNEDVAMIMKVMAFPAKLLRVGATLTPDFSIRNPLRDQFTAAVYSAFGFKPGINLVKGIFSLFKQDETYDLWRIAGGEHSMFVSLDRENLQKQLKDFVQSKGAGALNLIKNPLNLLRVISEIGEQGTRLGEMKRALDSGASPEAAAFASREVTLDFARMGAKMKGWNMIIAFFNANIQGSDKFVRSFKSNPFRTLIKTLLYITLPSILLYFANRNDKRWGELPQWQKDLFWIVFTPEHIYRIPKPFELGILFGSVPERVLEYLDTHNQDLIKQLEKSIFDGATPGFIPTGLTPILENMANYSYFRERPIVSQGKENQPAPMQTNTYTSEFAKIIGTALNYSPAKIDNLIQGYTGGLGNYGVKIIDKIISWAEGKNEPTKPALSLEDWPVLKAFMIRNPVGSSSNSVNKIYDLAAKYSGEYTYFKSLVDDGKTDEATQYAKDNPQLINHSVYNRTVAKFTDINKAITQIREDKTMSAQTKATKIELLEKLKTKIAQDILNLINQK